jgi:hypothetical protein
MNNEFGKMLREVVVAEYEVLYRIFLGTQKRDEMS